MDILGVTISELKSPEIINKIEEFLRDDHQHYIVTPNPEIILASHKDEEFFYILNQADLAPADGFGLKIAAWLGGKNLPRISGADLSPKIIKIAETKNYKVAVVNWSGGLSNKTEITQVLEKKYPNLKFLVIDTDKKNYLNESELNDLNDFQPIVLFTTLGAPYQEKMIWHNLKKIPSLRLALGVGGTFDFLTNKASRAPKIFRSTGMEWLWRLIKNPKRIKRIWRATFVFTAKAIKWRFIRPFQYRPNVACLLYRPVNNTYEILIVERRDAGNHWQIPQGGTDGESLRCAGARELFEEIGTKKFIVKATFKKLYKYRTSEIIRKVYGYKGQKQGLCIAEFTGTDSDIKLTFWDHRAWKWINLDNLVDGVHPVRQAGAKVFLDKFQEYLAESNLKNKN